MILLNPIINKIDPLAFTFIRANLSTRDEVLYETGWHVDFENVKAKTAVLYLNTNNGYTKFKETGDIVESISNRFLEFDTDMMHTGSTTTSEPNRIVLNFNYIPKPE